MKLRYSEFKDRINIENVEAALGFVCIAQQGSNDIGHCLFPENHANGDTTGKFAIHRDKLVYNCWVCSGGSLLSLVMECQHLDVDEATAWLYQYTSGIDTRSDGAFSDYLLEMLADIEVRIETLPYFNARVLDRFDGPVDYFRIRGISDQVIEDYRLCYGENTMKSAPIKHRDGKLVKEDEDYFGPTAIFPHYWQGKMVGWQHRWMEWDASHTRTPKWLAKYTNTTDFPKHDTLFNYDVALDYRHTSLVSVLESVPSVLFLQSNGYPAVSHFGGTIKDPQLRLLRTFSKHGVVLCPDNDKTGDQFVNAARKYLERYIPVYIAEKVDLGPKTDLGDYANTSNPLTNLRAHMTNRIHLAGVEI